MKFNIKQIKTILIGLIGLTAIICMSTFEALAEPNTNEVHSLVAQHHLDYDVPIFDGTLIGTHNSFSSAAYGSDYPDGVQNQNKSVLAQLQAGYRWLDIDAWQYADEAFSEDVDTRMCHGACWFDNNNLESFLNEVNTFINTSGNESEVIFVTIEDRFYDYLHWGSFYSADDGRERFEDEVTGHAIWSKIFTKDDLPSGIDYYQNDKCVIFPLSLSKRDILEAGKQIVLLRWNPGHHDSRCKDGSENSNIFNVTFDVPFEDIAPRDGQDDITIYESNRGDITQFYLAQDDRCADCLLTGKSITSGEYTEILEKGAHMVSLDFGVDQQKHAAVTWSWYEGEPNGNNNNAHCAEQYTSGRWNDLSCDSERRAACQSELTGEWKITQDPKIFAEADDACKKDYGSNFFFSTPVHAKANKRLREVADADNDEGEKIWINMVRHSKAGSSYVSASGNTVYVPVEAFTPGNYLKGGQSRKPFYLKDSGGGYVRHDCGGNCDSEDAYEDAYVDSTEETVTGIDNQLWLVQTYASGMSDFYLKTVDNTVWGVDLKDVAYSMSDMYLQTICGEDLQIFLEPNIVSNQHRLDFDGIVDFRFSFSETPDAHNWPTGSSNNDTIGISTLASNVMTSGTNHAPLEFSTTCSASGNCTEAKFYPYWSNPTNLARFGTATQISTLASYNASNAIDGNTDGINANNSITHTNTRDEDWWQVDLGQNSYLYYMDIYNRTDCCSDRLSDFYVLVSDTEFTSNDLATARAQASFEYYYAGAVGTSTTIQLSNTVGRYVRIQQTSGEFLSLAEVEIYGYGKDGPVAEFDFNSGSMNGESPSGAISMTNNGATTTTDRDGNATSAVSFNGAATLQGSWSQEFSSDLTMSVWFKANSGASDSRLVEISSSGNTAATTLMYTAAGQLHVWCQKEGVSSTSRGGAMYDQGSGLNDGKWHHAAMVHSNSGMILYIDGVEVSSTSNHCADIDDVSHLSIGSLYNNTSWMNFNGDIDEVKIYNMALSLNEVKDLYLSSIVKSAAVGNTYGGAAFETYLNHYDGEVINNMAIRSGGRLDYIEIEYDPDHISYGFGGGGGTRESLDLDVSGDEYINYVKICAGYSSEHTFETVHYIKLKTNDDHVLEGGSTSACIETETLELYDIRLLGFYGRAGGEIDQLGVYYSSSSHVATFYDDDDYSSGSSYIVSLPPGSYTLSQLQERGITNDSLTSLTISNSDYKVILYQHDNYGGSSVTIDSDTDDLTSYGFNNQTSSIVIEEK